MLGKQLQNARADFQAKRAVLHRQWRPLAFLLLALSSWGYARYLWQTTRDLGSLPAVGILLLGLLLFLLLFRLAPVGGFSLIPRAAAFLVDLVLLALSTFAVLSLLRRFGIVPNPWGLMFVAWLWFFYFVLFEMFLHRTPGKQLFGLTLVFHGKRGASFCTCLVRTCVSLLTPLLIIDLVRQPLPWRYVLFSPVEVSVAAAAVTLGPMSILFLPDARGIADRVAGTLVKELQKQDNLAQIDGRPGWLRLCLLCLSVSLYLYAATYFLDRRLKAHYGSLAAMVANVERPTMAEQLWVYLPIGLRNPPAFIKDISVWEFSPNPVTVNDASDFLVLLPYKDDIPKLREMRIVAVSLFPAATSIVKTRLQDNFLRYYVPLTEPAGLPAFVLLQLLDEEDFGLFTLVSAENMLLCVRRHGDRAIAFYVQPDKPRVGYAETYFVSRARWLMLGHLDMIAASRTTPWLVAFMDVK
jgi:uncharacterized RDD family membrane protein YckC